MEKIDNVYQITRTIIGEVVPYGSSEIDRDRLENLEKLISLTQSLISDIRDVAEYQTRPENSIKVMGRVAQMFLDDLSKSIEDEKYRELLEAFKETNELYKESLQDLSSKALIRLFHNENILTKNK